MTLLKICSVSLVLLLSACSLHSTKAELSQPNKPPIVTPQSTPEKVGNSSNVTVLPVVSDINKPGLNKATLPTPIIETHNAKYGFQLAEPISVVEALLNSKQSAEKMALLCRPFACKKDWKNVFNPEDSRVTMYKDTYIITWHTGLDSNTNIQNVDAISRSKTFLAEFTSLESPETLSNIVYSLTGIWAPTGQHNALDLLQVSGIVFTEDGGLDCVSSTCSYLDLLIKRDTIIARKFTTRSAGGRYGIGRSCGILSQEAMLICLSYSGYNDTGTIISTVSLK